MLFVWRAGCCDLCCDWNAMACVVNYGVIAMIGVARDNVWCGDVCCDWTGIVAGTVILVCRVL